MRASRRTGLVWVLALAGMLVACSSAASPSVAPVATPSPTIAPTPTAGPTPSLSPDVAPSPSPPATPSPTPAPTASSAAAPTMPAEFEGTWTTMSEGSGSQFPAFAIGPCALGQECPGALYTTSAACWFPLHLVEIGDRAVVLDVGENPEPEAGCDRRSGYQARHRLIANGDGTLEWGAGEDWSRTLFPFSGNLDG